MSNARPAHDMIFDHIGVVVSVLDEGRAFFATTLPIFAWTEPVEDPGLGVTVQFGCDASGVVYELIAPLGESSPVSGSLRAGRVLHHVAYRVPSLAPAADRLRAAGCRETGPAHPAVAYDGADVQFFVSPLRSVIELIEAPAHQHRWRPVATGPDDAALNR